MGTRRIPVREPSEELRSRRARIEGFFTRKIPFPKKAPAQECAKLVRKMPP